MVTHMISAHAETRRYHRHTIADLVNLPKLASYLTGRMVFSQPRSPTMSPRRQQKRSYPSPAPSNDSAQQVHIPLQHPIHSYFPEQAIVQGPSVQELMKTSRLPGVPRLTFGMGSRTERGTKGGILRRSGMVFENLMSETNGDGWLTFGHLPGSVRQRTKTEKVSRSIWKSCPRLNGHQESNSPKERF